MPLDYSLWFASPFPTINGHYIDTKLSRKIQIPYIHIYFVNCLVSKFIFVKHVQVNIKK